MTRPCPKCKTELEVIAVDTAGHEIMFPCQVCERNRVQKHQTGATSVDGK